MVTSQMTDFNRPACETEISHNLNKLLSNDIQNVKTIVKLLGVHKRNIRQVSQELHAFMIKLNSLVKKDKEPNGGEKKL